ncbi:MAG: hypothetical protein KBA28_01140 [Syntrophaceae bacterium]|jgi:hypothetical protein|nr:hypothetical protein [Syntrophaceae bacterium]HOC58770.1 hypothetical protein [Smithellaceae bacterium]HQM45625.1 hypothetical protein [Smithellaceae bacterium]
MSKVKPGDVLNCEVCGLTLIVDEECGCAMAELVCCEEPMKNKGPKVPKKAVSEPKKKTMEKKETQTIKEKVAVKPDIKKTVVQKSVAKTALKKPTAEKKAGKK